jgi:uncharacterized protein (TIGR03000 family)
MYSMVLMAALATNAAAPDCFFHRHHGCSGGWGCHGYYGNGNGYGCFGCYGCYGCYGGNGCYGGAGCVGCYGCYGCYGGGGVVEAPPAVVPEGGPGGGMPKVGEGEKKKKKEEDEDSEEEESSAGKARAKVTVKLPADAKLYIDDQLMKTPSAKRVFSTPVLTKGQVFYYVLRARVVRNGQTLTQTKRILIRAGQQVSTTFEDPSTQLASNKWKRR